MSKQFEEILISGAPINHYDRELLNRDPETEGTVFFRGGEQKDYNLSNFLGVLVGGVHHLHANCFLLTARR